MDRLDLRLVEYFIAVAEELHFGRAAARLHIAQPSLSYQIKRLEEQVGVKLLHRSTRHVELTAAGEIFLRSGRQLLDQAQRMVRDARTVGGEQLTVGFGGSAAGDLLSDVLRAFGSRHPSVLVSIRELRLDGAEEILSGDIDVAFTRLEPGQVDAEVEILLREPRVVALPTGHHLAERDAVEFADLRDEGFVSNPVVHGSGPPAHWLTEQQRHGLPGRVVAQASSLQETLTLVETGRGVCMLPESVADLFPRREIRYVAVRDAEPAVVSLAWNRSNSRPVVGTFIRTVREIASSRDTRHRGARPDGSYVESP